jgi:DNA repair protein RecN (Recombination protein N)
MLALTKSIDKLEKQARSDGEQLTNSRKGVFVRLKKELETLLRDVGMPDALIEIQHEVMGLHSSGMDKISLLFSANKGILPSLIGKVASGGELSRLMFCVKYILADKTALPTIIFDEIDTGVSGEVALKMGRMMSAMAGNHQVVTITHLPQIAANAQSHYYVYKDEESGKAVSKIKLLDVEERLHEVATMIGGERPSEAAYSSARELIMQK